MASFGTTFNTLKFFVFMESQQWRDRNLGMLNTRTEREGESLGIRGLSGVVHPVPAKAVSGSRRNLW